VLTVQNLTLLTQIEFSPLLDLVPLDLNPYTLSNRRKIPERQSLAHRLSCARPK
jgi:hypothetical protein